jgi:hypothetical protein
LANLALITTDELELVIVREPPEQVQFHLYVDAPKNEIVQTNVAVSLAPEMGTPWTVIVCPACLPAVSVPPDPVMDPLVERADVFSRLRVFAVAVRGAASAKTQAKVKTHFMFCIC